MWSTLAQILERTAEHLAFLLQTYIPPLLAGAIILVGAWMLAVLSKWAVNRIFKGVAVDRFLNEYGVFSMLDRSGQLRARRIVASALYWVILAVGALAALSAVHTEMTNRMVSGLMSLLPKIVTAGLILLAGAWLAQYLSRSALIWASNENIPAARKLAGAVRIVIWFVAVVVVADHLDFARSVFLAAFVILVGGFVLAASIAVGSASRDAIRRQLEPRPEPESMFERSLRNHL
jgi:hypothetical protein